MINEYKALAEYENVIKQQIEDSWNPEQEAILKAWAEKASGWAWLHDKSSRIYNKASNMNTYSSIMLSTISGGIGFMLGDVQNGTHSEQTTFALDKKLLTFSIGCMNIVSAALTTLQKFTRCSEKTETHSQMHKQFSSYCRKIVLELALQPRDRKECIEFCKQCRDEYDRLVENSPQIPSRVIRQFRQTFHDAEHVPEIANGLVHFVDKNKCNQTVVEDHGVSLTV
jgi:hypothetical protein